MPIEFRCPSCSKLLRTPDESAGKKAKCPQCGGIADVPHMSTGGAPGQPGAPIPPAMPEGGLPPGKPPSPFGPTSINPYASPAPVASTPMAGVSRGPLVPARISFDRIFESVWQVFQPQLGPMVLFGSVVLGVNIVLQIIGQGGNYLVQQTGEPLIFVGFTVINSLVGMLVQTWIGIGTVIFMLKAARNEGPTINDLGLAGPYFIRGLLLQLLIMVVLVAIVTVFLIPAGILLVATREPRVGILAAAIGGLIAVAPLMYIFYSWLLAMFFIIDCNLGVLESVSQSSRFMAGNKLISFLILLVIGILGGLFTIFTCCVGYIFVISYMSLAMAAIYLSASSQPWGLGTKSV